LHLDPFIYLFDDYIWYLRTVNCALLGESLHEVSEGLIGLLSVAPKVPGISKAHICALEVPDEDLDQVGPVVDYALREMLEPCSGRIGQV